LTVGVEIFDSEVQEVVRIAQKAGVSFKETESPFDPNKKIIEIITMGSRSDAFFEKFREWENQKNKSAQEIL
jgi:hypothetical protein